MIADLSRTLRALLTAPSVPRELAAVDIAFDHPNESFTPTRTTLNLFLYDIREDLELRNSEPTLLRQPPGALLLPPPLRVVCSYLLTAWPVGGEEPALQEHSLLGHALALLRCHPTLPDALLQGSLKSSPVAPAMSVAQAPPGNDPRDFWTAIGNRLRPSITVRVALAIALAEPAPQTAALVQLHALRLGERNAANPAQAIKPAPRSRRTAAPRTEN